MKFTGNVQILVSRIREVPSFQELVRLFAVLVIFESAVLPCLLFEWLFANHAHRALGGTREGSIHSLLPLVEIFHDGFNRETASGLAGPHRLTVHPWRR